MKSLPHFQLGPGFWACIPQHLHDALLRRYTTRAKELVADSQQSLLAMIGCKLLVEAAVEAQVLHHMAPVGTRAAHVAR